MDRMEINTYVYLSLVCTWWSLHAGRFPLIVTAQSQQMMSAKILTHEADRKEGRRVQMKCTASYFDFENLIFEWQKDNITLIQDGGTVTSDPRFGFFTAQELNNMVITKLLVITGVHRDDSGVYTCNLIDKRGASGSNIAVSVQVTLSVLYFPSESFPICSPAGSITTVTGTELNIQCSSEVGNPQVMMEIYQTKYNDTFTLSHHGDMISMSLALTAHIDYNGILFWCNITSPKYYPGMSRSCYIGPINVSNVTSPTYPSHNETTEAAIIAGAVAGVVVLIIVIIILIIFCRSRPVLCKRKQLSEDNTSCTIPKTTASPQGNNSEPFQQNFNNDNRLGLEHDYQNRAADDFTDQAPGSSSSPSGITLLQRAEVPDSSPIYAKPRKAPICPDNATGVTNITEQSYTNPMFDSKGTEDTTRPLQDHPKMSIKPVAIVQPNMKVPKKPAPYRPKPDRTSNTNDNLITSPSHQTQEHLPGHPNDDMPTPGTAQVGVDGHTPQETSSPPSDVTYAQVSVPIRQNSSSSQRPGNDITYAELDLTSQTLQNDVVKPSSSAVGPAIYATVTKMN